MRITIFLLVWQGVMVSEFSDTTYPDITGIIAVLANPPKPSTYCIV